ncbi:hypothetical protein ACFQ9X_50480 [Catenulispora yoronensis]
MFDLATPSAPQPLTPLAGHTDYTLGVAFSPDSTLLAASSQDQSILIWRF